MRSLRPDQSDAIENLRQSILEKHHHVVMQAPTGYGKTVLSAELVNRACRKDKKVIFAVPAISLIDQTLEMFNSQGITDIGVLQASHRQTDGCMPVQIVSVQTLQKREMPPADVVIIDEVHRWFESYAKWMQTTWLNTPVIGLSATPWRRGLGNSFTRLLKGATIQELIDGGLLSDFKVFAPDHPDLSGIKTTGGDYNEEQLSERMSNVKLVASIVDTWLEHGRGRPTLVFAVDRAHAEKLQLQFEERGVRAAYQDHFTKDADRRAIKRGFHDGSIEVVVNIETLTTGIDWDVRCIVLARPTKSEMLFVQAIGRGLRTAAGKDHCLILDHSLNHLNLGFVTDIDVEHTELLRGESKTAAVTDRIRLPKECPSCAFLKPPGTAKCPVCGFVAEKHSKIEPTQGELKEMERKRKEEKEKAKEINPRVFYAELRSYADPKGYNPKWAAAKYLDKFKEWPPFEWNNDPMCSVSAQTANWIKSTNIRWAKGKGRYAS